jgi:FecR-like protein
MATQPPPTPAVPRPAVPPATPRRSGCFGRGCGFGCGGCLVAVVLVALIAVGGGYYFIVAQAQAAVAAPAALIVFMQKVSVDGKPGTSGQQLNAGNTASTDHTGHAAIQFPDGSSMRMAPDTSVTVTAVQLQKDGNLQSVSVQQKVGRTLTNVQHLISGASFQVAGHSVSASVRGTQFEVLVRPDHTNLIKVFEGTVKVTGATTATLNANQQIDADANGRLSNQRPIQPDPKDPFPVLAQCTKAASAGTTPGTIQSASGDDLATGQTAEVDYYAPGGTVSVTLCYPGSVMTLDVIDPNGTDHALRQAARPLQLNLSGPPGRYRAIVHAISVPGGEPYSVSFASTAPCAPGNVDNGTVVRETLSNADLARGLQQSGAGGITLQVEGTSPTAARIYYSSSLGGFPISWNVDFYPATPNLGAVITQVSIRGVNVTMQVVSRLTSATGASISSIPSGFTVDRVYSCNGSGGDMMVIEGHH